MVMLLTLAVLTPPLHAQDTPSSLPASGVLIERDSLRLGFNQKFRPGSWMPVQVSFNNTLARAAKVRLELLVPDADRDMARYQRIVTLTPQRSGQRVWIYAMAPVSTDHRSQWRLQALDDETGRLLDYKDIVVGERFLSLTDTTVGIVGGAMMGLDPYTSNATQHEAIHFVRGLQPEHLPDRWHGLSMFSSLIWTSQVNPAGPMVTPDIARAIRQWVYRGGHLVIILPVAGNAWPGSPMADLLPPATDDLLHEVSPLFLGTSRLPPEQIQNISVRRFEPGPGVTPVLFLNDDPWVIAHRLGRGRVTLVGVDLSDPRLTQMGLPSSGRWTPWSDIMGWRGPALPESYIKSEMDAGRMNRPDQRNALTPGQFIAPKITMHETAAPQLLLAIMVFVIYWIIAGPTQHIVLKSRGMVRHAWLGFVIIVLAFAIFTWTSAWFLRPTRTEARHFSVLTATQGSSQSHVHSWLSLYVPVHGQVDVRLESPGASSLTAAGSASNAIWSTSLGGETSESAFSDSRTYAVDATSPQQVNFSYRSTAKQLELDYLGDLPAPARVSSEAAASTDAGQISWQTAQGLLTVINGWPTGELKHQLPGSLHHVTVVFNDGRKLPNGQLRPPTYWLYTKPWEPGEALQLAGNPGNTQPLVTGIAPAWAGRLVDLTRRFSNADDMEQIELLTFFSMLPPPDYLDVSFRAPVRTYQRPLGRELDLTAQSQMRCVIITGLLRDAPLPAPLQVDGEVVPSRGDVAVRWIFPLP